MNTAKKPITPERERELVDRLVDFLNSRYSGGDLYDILRHILNMDHMREALETLRAQMHRLVDERIDDAAARMESGEIWGRSWNRSKVYQQNKSETAHCAASDFCFRTRDGWYPLFALEGRCVRFWKRRRGVAPLG